MPATQSMDSDLCWVVGDVTSVLHKHFWLTFSCCIFKFEWDAIESHSRMNNVQGVNGFEPNNTGLQMNVSSGFTSLT